MHGHSPDKLQQLLSALRRGMVMVHLDARRPGVVVPAELSGEPHLRLNLSYRFRSRDLSVGEWGVCSTLSFSGKRFTVSFPWTALFAITSHASKEFWMFPEALPPELAQPGAYMN
jgi:stringent starvation protein B